MGDLFTDDTGLLAENGSKEYCIKLSVHEEKVEGKCE